MGNPGVRAPPWGKGRALLLARLTSCVFFLAACGTEAGLKTETLPSPPMVETASDLIATLEMAGVNATATADPSAPYFGVAGTVYLVGAEPVQVFEFESQAARRAVSETIASDGLSVAGRPVVWPDRPNIWAMGRLIVVYPGTDGGTILLLGGLLGDPLTYSAPGGDEPYPPAVTSAIRTLAAELAVDPVTVEVLAFEEVSWPDSCLGLPDPGEDCVEVITPGWRITLRLMGQTLDVRTDRIGDRVRHR